MEMVAYERTYGPVGHVRTDYQMAYLAYVTAAVQGGAKGKALEDFLLWKPRARSGEGVEADVMKVLGAKAQVKPKDG